MTQFTPFKLVIYNDMNVLNKENDRLKNVCTKCRRHFESHAECKKHYQNKGCFSKEEYVCAGCNKVFDTRELLMEHHEKFHPVKIQIPVIHRDRILYSTTPTQIKQMVLTVQMRMDPLFGQVDLNLLNKRILRSVNWQDFAIHTSKYLIKQYQTDCHFLGNSRAWKKFKKIVTQIKNNIDSYKTIMEHYYVFNPDPYRRC